MLKATALTRAYYIMQRLEQGDRRALGASYNYLWLVWYKYQPPFLRDILQI
jgi:hypothetical protein